MNKMIKKAIFITVRMNSSRLPQKAVIPINNNELSIEHLINRVKKSALSNIIVLCTTENAEDDFLCDLAKKNNIEFFRGSEKDKLERWNQACKKFNIDFFVTADGDDLFCEPKFIDNAFRQFDKDKMIDFIHCPGIICGAFTYGINSRALEKVCEIKDSDDTEMMWTYFLDTGLFYVRKLENIEKKYFRNDIRMTLDYPDDLLFFKRVISNFEHKTFDIDDILDLLNSQPEIIKINEYLSFEWKLNQTKKTKLKLKNAKSI